MRREAWGVASAISFTLLACGIRASDTAPTQPEAGLRTQPEAGSPTQPEAGPPAQAEAGPPAHCPVSTTMDAGSSSFPIDVSDGSAAPTVDECGLEPLGTPGDPQTDPHNCGSCSHDCGGGACVAGRCQACLLASTPVGFGGALAIDGDFVYFDGQDEPETVARVPTRGGPSEVVFTSPNAGILWFGIDAGTLYVVTFVESQSGGTGALLRLPAAGGPSTTLATFASMPGSATMAADTVYVALDVGPGDVEVHAVPKSGATAVTLPAATAFLGVVDPQAYLLSSTGAMQSVAKTGGAATNVPGGQRLDGFSTTETFDGLLYVSVGPSIVTFDPSTSAFATIVAGEQRPESIGIDSTGTYWTASNAIRWLPAGASVPATLWTILGNSPYGVLLDSTSVYWTQPAGDLYVPMLLKLAK